MRKRGTVSRCCCGDQSGAGNCSDSCLSNWNSCTAAATGLLYGDAAGPELSALIDAWNNCGWYRVPNATNTINGQNGEFQLTDAASIGKVRRMFSFDYRTITSFTIAYTSTLGNGTGSFNRNAVQVSMLPSTLDEDFILQHITRNTFTSTTTVDFLGQSIPVDDQVTLSITGTLDPPFETSVNTESYFDGTIYQTATSCRETMPVNYEITLNGAVVGTVASLVRFAGVRCYAGFQILLRTLAEQPGAVPLAQTSNMTISVT